MQRDDSVERCGFLHLHKDNPARGMAQMPADEELYDLA